MSAAKKACRLDRASIEGILPVTVRATYPIRLTPSRNREVETKRNNSPIHVYPT